jgi:RimJ/RimL family protein N-acetyltransferase
MQVRVATMDDAGLLHRWADDPDTRRWSFTTDPIPWGVHVAWLKGALREGVLLIGEDEGGPVGSVRFDADGEVSITVAPARRGCGLARPLLESALLLSPTRRVVAHVRPENEASMRLFSTWADEGVVRSRGVSVHRFVHEAPTVPRC